MSNRKKIYAVLASFVTTMAMLIQYNMPEQLPDVANAYSRMTRAIYTFWLSMQADAMIQVAMFIGFAIGAYMMYDYVKENKTILLQILTFLLAVMMAVGKSMQATSSLILMYHGPLQIMKTIMIIVGYYILYLYVALAIHRGIHTKQCKVKSFGQKFFEKNGFRNVFGLMAIVWFPQIILKYPAAMCYDTYTQLFQFYGEQRFTSHHPPFDTWLMGTFVNFGKTIGSMNVGLFLYIVVQTTFFIWVLTNTIMVLERRKISYLYRSILLAIYCVVPYFVGYSGVVIKDTIYGICMIWYFTCLVNLIEDQAEYVSSWKNVAQMIVSATLVSLTRNNGIYVVAPTAIALIIYFVKVHWNVKKTIVRFAWVLILPIVLYVGISSALVKEYKIQPGSKREMLSIPFQQTARYVKEYGNEIPQEEKEAIDAVLNYNKIGELYAPLISDPVKQTFKDAATKEQMKEYFRVWFKQFCRHPLVYIEATLNSNYGIFCPDVDNYVYYATAADKPQVETIVNFEVNPTLKHVQESLITCYKMVHELPVIGLFANIAFYVLTFLYIFVFMIKDKKYRYLLLTIPGMLSIAIAIASPVFMGHPRYLFPIVYTVPLLFAVYAGKVEEEV